MKPIQWLFSQGRPTAKASDVVLWWELRRIPYNLVVGLIGFLSVFVLEFLGGTMVQPGEDVVEPLGLIFGVLAFGIAANVCYTFGWIVELAWSKGDWEKGVDFRLRTFRAGLVFSCLLTSLPIWIVLLIWAFHKLH